MSIKFTSKLMRFDRAILYDFFQLLKDKKKYFV